MKIIARCHPQLEPLLPRPVPAAQALPGWLRAMPGQVEAETLGGAPIRTLKHCPPFIDALSLGLMIPLATDLHVKDGEISWDWDPPIIPDAPLTRAPIGLHAPEQASGMPVNLDARMVIKFTNFWTLEAPAGWSLLFTHPLNRADLPFQTLSGVVDCDLFGLGYVHFPALWTDTKFEGTLPAGTPVAQVIPVPREAVGCETTALNSGEVTQSREIQEALQAETGVYRRRFRH
ncbi:MULTISPECIES: hypothetical protein [Actibacterium]|uniref:Uncharacterized protein n=1 Tax=Actibacterium naphthalenivorans TaxID=1614693 RepID=A0A840CE19_9RHOB|nr:MULTISPECIES: hypothetical protein [Actibacterium]ALG91077.1 hypothetical protein TQ29_13915 [Actibacterium sp. EMB200-NS6]MBB4023480.1 hypothetical protein [Actibacterium naphthalenivorans]